MNQILLRLYTECTGVTIMWVIFANPEKYREVILTFLLFLVLLSDAAFSSAPGSVSFNSATSSVEQEEPGVKLPLSLDLLRPIFKVLGHCLMSSMSPPEVQEEAAATARALYVRASQDLVPEAIMAARSLVRLDAHAAAEARAIAASSSLSSMSTPNKPRKSDMFLMPS